MFDESEVTQTGVHPISRGARVEAVFTVALICAGLSGFGWHLAYLAPAVVDDAAITIAYGLTFFAGEGLRLTPSSPPVEGFSNPTWVFLTGVSGPLGLEPVEFTRLLGIIFGMAALLVFCAWGPVNERRLPRVEDALPALVAATVPSFTYWTGSGMETGLYTFLIGLSGLLLLGELRSGKSAWVGIALALLALTRPEGALFAAVGGAFWFVHRAVQRRLPGRQELKIVAALVAIVGAYQLLRWTLFASVLANTYYAKRLWDFNARSYLETAESAHGFLVLAVKVGGGLALLGGLVIARRAVLALLFLGAGAYFAHRVKGDWMREWRFLAPLAPLAGVVIASGVGGARRLLERIAERWKLSWLRPFALVLVVAAVPGIVWKSVEIARRRSPPLKRSPELPVTEVLKFAAELKKFEKHLGIARPLLGIADIGGVALDLRHAEIMDAAGLADYAVARHAGNAAAIEDYLLSEGPPDIVDPHGPSGHVRGMSKLMKHYEHASVAVPTLAVPPWVHTIRGLTAEEDPRCPGGKKTVLSLSPEALGRTLREQILGSNAQTAIAMWRCALRYQPEARLPEPAALTDLAVLADREGERLLVEGDREKALRSFSLATVLDGHDAHRRRKAEKLRAELFTSSR